jgi:hypothetical protein
LELFPALLEIDVLHSFLLFFSQIDLPHFEYFFVGHPRIFLGYYHVFVRWVVNFFGIATWSLNGISFKNWFDVLSI